MSMLSPTRGDPFEPFKVLYTNLRIWQVLCCLSVVGMAIIWYWGALGWARPPIVIVKDRVHAEAATVSHAGGAPAVTAADARVFFLNMVKLRFGWDSLTVMRDMREFRKQCYRDHWAVEERHFEEMVPQATDPKKTTTRMNWWVQQGVRNTLVSPASLEDIDCREEGDRYHCKWQTSLITQPILPAPEESPVVHRMIFIGSLFKVPHRVETPYGLMVGMMRQLPAESRKERQG